MQKYKIIKILGDGAFGTVFKAVNTKTNQVVAIKKMKSKYKQWDECLELREIKSLRKLSHPTLIKLKEVLLVSEELHLVFEYLQTNLYEEYSNRSKEGRHFSQKQIKNILFQIASGLAHMHKNGFFHRDLKPQNLLISGDIVKLCDMGLARQIRSRPPFTDYVSTRWYRAPELLLRSTNYNSPVDVFAFGCIAAELYNLSPLFPGSNDIDQLNRIVKVLGTPDVSEWPQGYKLAKSLNYNFSKEIGVSLYQLIPRASFEAIDLIQSTLRYSSRKRLTMLEVLKHDYFKDQGLKVIQEQQKKKQIVFQQKQVGPALDYSKHEKKLEEFRQTKQKFRQTRWQDAFKADPLKHLDKGKKKEADPAEDIDQILRQLEQKKLKDKKGYKQIKPLRVPSKMTRQKFYTEVEKTREPQISYKIHKQQKTEAKQSSFRYNTNNQELSSNDAKSYKKNMFSFGFQPASLPYLAPMIHQKQNTPILHPKVKRQPIHYSLGNNYNESNNKSNKLKSLSPLISQFHY